jgi:hypothetical protein
MTDEEVFDLAAAVDEDGVRGVVQESVGRARLEMFQGYGHSP